MKFELLEPYHRWIWNCQSCSTCQKGPQNVFSPAGPTPDRICPSYDKYPRLAYSGRAIPSGSHWVLFAFAVPKRLADFSMDAATFL